MQGRREGGKEGETKEGKQGVGEGKGGEISTARAITQLLFGQRPPFLGGGIITEFI